MRCKIPITPAFGSVMDATSEGTINDPTLDQLGIRAILRDIVYWTNTGMYPRDAP